MLHIIKEREAEIAALRIKFCTNDEELKLCRKKIINPNINNINNTNNNVNVNSSKKSFLEEASILGNNIINNNQNNLNQSFDLEKMRIKT